MQEHGDDDDLRESLQKINQHVAGLGIHVRDLPATFTAEDWFDLETVSRSLMWICEQHRQHIDEAKAKITPQRRFEQVFEDISRQIGASTKDE